MDRKIVGMRVRKENVSAVIESGQKKGNRLGNGMSTD